MDDVLGTLLAHGVDPWVALTLTVYLELRFRSLGRRLKLLEERAAAPRPTDDRPTPVAIVGGER